MFTSPVEGRPSLWETSWRMRERRASAALLARLSPPRPAAHEPLAPGGSFFSRSWSEELYSWPTFPLLMRLLALFLLLASPLARAAEQPPLAPPSLALHNGDRVLLLGDALLEREDEFGFLETSLVEQFADQQFTVRNLSWSGDTPHGVSRASFDPPGKGWERLRDQIAGVRPTVAILGFGMAASLQELSDRSGDLALNPDPARYGREPMTAARFKNELGQLLDELRKNGTERLLLLSPIRHEDLRAQRPGLPDPAAHEKLLVEYAKVIEELAHERGAGFLSLRDLVPSTEHLTADGIHPTRSGDAQLWERAAVQLGWKGPLRPDNGALREAIVRKNQLFFYRWRPENYTYLFGFRKHEQGRNAKEIPQFDRLIAQAEERIASLKAGVQAATKAASIDPAPVIASATQSPSAPPTLPAFTVQPGFQIDLWATNPLLEKPIQMNWDADGRLWLASSSTYPQVNPEDVATTIAQSLAAQATGSSSSAPSAGNDKIIIVEASHPGGPPDKSTVFADGLLIPTGVAPIRTPDGHWGCYVGQSTELLELIDTDGDGRADTRRVVLSGFGTEDTHHLVHTLKWDPQGRLNFDQSIYIHSHFETPWGMVRVNSGAVMSWDPRTERVEVHYKGFCNPWGHVWDEHGEEFFTDGAGFQGVAWGIQGAQYFTYENARKICPSISPGSYPKFASLEIIRSPHFPADWQGSLITCDFRAHRLVHFGLNDLSQNTPPRSGYITTELPDLVRTSDLSFRPIDVQLGPDGALYVADWSNPVINHGEVDFRDPRRDHHQGRIWKITQQHVPLLPWRKLSGLSPNDVRSFTPNPWEQKQAALLWEGSGFRGAERAPAPISPRARLETMRHLASVPTLENASQVLDLALSAPANDPYYDYAAWLSVNEVAGIWSASVLYGSWPIDSPVRERQLVFALKAIEPALAAPVLAKVLADHPNPLDGSGPWIELIGQAGGAPELGQLLTLATTAKAGPATEKALMALREAWRLRALKPAGDLATIEPLVAAADPRIAGPVARLIGAWKTPHAAQLLHEAARGTRETSPLEVRLAAVDGLRALGGSEAIATLRTLAAQRPPQGVPIAAAVALASLDPRDSAPEIMALLASLPSESELLEAWRAFLAGKGAPDQFAALVGQQHGTAPLPQPAIAAGLRVARELGKPGQKLLAALTSLSATKVTSPVPAADYEATAELVKRDGDPARGEEVYRRATLLCTTCHAIGGAGGKVGPELTSLGASAPLDYIIESVLAPAAKVKEGFNALSVTLKDGTAAIGIPSRETTDEIFLRTVTGQEIAVVKENITSKEFVGSIMPAGLAEQLQPREQLDLYAFLSQLGKPGAFDASKGNVARYWALADGVDATKPADEGSPHTPAYTLVDGRLTSDLLRSAATQISAGDATITATARFELPAAGPAHLHLTGAPLAWLDGKELSVIQGEVTVPGLAAGTHALAVQIDPRHLPEVLRLECPEAHFLGN